MDRFTQTALDFCRECLGWQDVREDGLGLYVYSHPERPKQLLSYGDLNAVMAAVQGWIAERPLDLEIHLGKVAEGYVVLLKRYEKHGKHRVMADAFAERDENPCQALLAACVEASRKLAANDRTSSTGSVSVSKPHKEE